MNADYEACLCQLRDTIHGLIAECDALRAERDVLLKEQDRQDRVIGSLTGSLIERDEYISQLEPDAKLWRAAHRLIIGHNLLTGAR